MATLTEASRKHGEHGNHRNRSMRGGYGHYANFNRHGALDESFERFADEGRDCERSFKDFMEKINSRYRKCSRLEEDVIRRHEELKAEAKALAEERKLVASWKAEAAAMRAKAQKDLMEIRSEREQLERASTDLAVQLAELKRVQREISKSQGSGEATEQQAASLVVHDCTRKADKVAENENPSKRIKLSSGSKKKECNGKLVSVQAALQEDAPGLFELLEEKGLLDDMDIITNAWDNEQETQEASIDGFQDLAAVIGKLWGPSTGLAKESRSRVHSVNGSKPNYCLPCLASLIEQTRVLKKMNWPVKWGWCRTLQSFIFVFENHNRIVVERPEYGYATYFFELIRPLTIKWQVERLVRVMSSVCNCRAALLENRPLTVGKDLLPEEAEVLEKYGWTPNTGIGSLLNFCDRVLHDYKSSSNDDEAGEWRPKIGKLLMDGHDQGSIVAKVPSRNANDDYRNLPVKLEDGQEMSRMQMVLARVKEEP